MEEHNLTNEQILAFSTALFQAERSQATVENICGVYERSHCF